MKKNLKKLSFLVFLFKVGYFWRIFLCFSESVLSDASFELSKTAFGQIFKISTIRRDTSDLVGGKNFRQGEDGIKN